MKIYIASSWKNAIILRYFAAKVRECGHEVYLFCDEKETACQNSIKARMNYNYTDWDAKEALKNKEVGIIYESNMEHLVPADLLILFLPCGNSSHLEAGFKKGQGKSVVIYGVMEKGQWDAMYLMVDRIFNAETESTEFFEYLKELGAVYYENSVDEGRE